jgi:mannosyltransferase OCH1-like enzyme
LPDEHERWQQTWREQHPGWKVKLWGEGDIPAGCLRPEVHERLRHPAERSDILRLEILRQEGGVYVDTDMECLRPVDELLDGVALFLGDLKPGRTNNAIIGAVPGHPLLEEALRGMRPAQVFGEDPKDGTGPHYLDRLVSARRDSITIFPPAFFYPPVEQPDDAYAIHHAARSWVDADGLRYRLQKAEARAAASEAALDAVLHGGLPRRLRVALRRRS